MSNPPLIPSGWKQSTQQTPIKYGSINDGAWSPDWSVSDDGKGLLTGTLRFFWNAPANKPRTSIVKSGQPHPLLGKLLCNSVSTTLTANDISYVEASYVGLDQDPAGLTWSLNTPTEDEPIECHPDFAKPDKGWGTVTKSGYNENGQPYWDGKNVIVDSDGKFGGFRFNESNWDNKFVGVTSYKAARATCSVSFYTANAELVSTVSKSLRTITDPYGATLPVAFPSGCNWLCTSVSVSQYSDTIFQVQAEYALSGSRGWSEKIYPPPTDA